MKVSPADGFYQDGFLRWLWVVMRSLFGESFVFVVYPCHFFLVLLVLGYADRITDLLMEVYGMKRTAWSTGKALR